MLDPTKVRVCHTTPGVGRILLSCRFSNDGRFLVAGGMMPEVLQYELVRTGDRVDWTKPAKLLKLNGHSTWVSAIAFTPDGKRVFTVDYAGYLGAWDFPARDAQQPPAWLKPAHDGWIRAIAVSPDGQQVASCGNDHAVRLWSTTDGSLIRELRAHECHVYNLAFHPKIARLISSDLKGRLIDWDLATGKMVREFDAKEMFARQGPVQLGGARCLTISPDGGLLAVGGMYGYGGIGDGIGAPGVFLFDLANGKRQRILGVKDGHRAFVNGLVFLPNLIVGATGGLDGGMILFWKPGEDKAFHQFKAAASGWSLAVHPDGSHIAIAHHDHSVRCYDLST
jgi:WD40 repeat protein